MNTAVMPLAFDFEGHAVRTINHDGATWWVMTDVCKVLGIANAPQAATRLDEDEKATIIINDSGTLNAERTIINESGLYSLILTSRKAAAKRFKKWITAEVLPTLRRTGTYSVGASPDFGRVLSVAEAAIHASQNAVKVLTPKAQAYHQLSCMDGLHTLTDAAKLCEMPRNRFLSTLEAVGWIYRPGGSGRWQGKADKIKAGFLTHKYHETRDSDGHLKERSQVVVTDRGIAKLRVVLTRFESAMLEGGAA
ncbi:antirepressor [Acetobacter senegalensis]|uniref:Antirepressor n=2 Tax=Acetobacter TaxID=434 RepID=A0A252EHL2_9PROT|nr:MULTISPECIES: phage antirepressor KilAC domain-containing protein [Acetobacter]ATJ89977.1 phage antirepressor Ant [Acetobacter tropicalis]KAA8383971.1 phage antirepressor Ant [Acetobacter tropicalis]KAA8386117.1 phage antirepressor Ant [Acetobacter tropicalis]KGB24749.1 Phage antirepressor protein [Acetobacter tropicalis]MBC9007453.1 phage antirepressor KilAC domain-containing protein [Acetobacter tropicalis]